MTFLFNLAGAGLDWAVFLIFSQGGGMGEKLGALLAWFLLLGASALLIAGPGFYLMRLAAYGCFLHGGILLGGLAFLFWPEVPPASFALVAGVVFLGAAAVDSFLIEPFWLKISHIGLKSGKLKRVLKLAIIADIQTDRIGRYEKRMLARAAAERADLILIIGDHLQPRRPEDFERLRSELNGSLLEAGLEPRLGIFCLGGNIDHPRWPAIFEGVPGAVALSQTRTVELGEAALTCLAWPDSRRPDAGIPPRRDYHILAGHCPDFSLCTKGGDLLIAGHTHGGQVRFPLLGPFFTFSKVPRSRAAGLTDLGDGRALYVSRGIGMERGPAPRLRFLCRPELAIIEVIPA